MKTRRRSILLGLVLLVFCLACRWYTPAADFYAEYCYPWISGGLSLAASVVPFSLEEITVLSFVFCFIVILISALRKKEGFLRLLRKTAVLVLWLFVWFYMGWGNNYYRTGLYRRNDIQRVNFERESFMRFLDDYARELNGAAAAAGTYDKEAFEAEIHAFYSDKVSAFGYTKLHGWQHTKRPLLNSLYSAVLVSGYTGPFFCETQVNLDLLEYEYPYVAAHEFAHLAGVTSEAEAGYWGFACCRESENAAVRYSGYLSVLRYVISNAKDLLPQEDYQAWTATLCEKAKADYTEAAEYWKTKRVDWINDLQGRFYDLYLRSNGVSEGTADYYGVVAMIMTMDAVKK